MCRFGRRARQQPALSRDYVGAASGAIGGALRGMMSGVDMGQAGSTVYGGVSGSIGAYSGYNQQKAAEAAHRDNAQNEMADNYRKNNEDMMYDYKRAKFEQGLTQPIGYMIGETTAGIRTVSNTSNLPPEYRVRDTETYNYGFASGSPGDPRIITVGGVGDNKQYLDTTTLLNNDNYKKLVEEKPMKMQEILHEREMNESNYNERIYSTKNWRNTENKLNAAMAQIDTNINGQKMAGGG